MYDLRMFLLSNGAFYFSRFLLDYGRETKQNVTELLLKVCKLLEMCRMC